MTRCFFVSDLHGSRSRYDKLLDAIRRELPDLVFIGGDLFPSGMRLLRSGDASVDSFLEEVLHGGCSALRAELGGEYPRIFLIPGNDDPAALLQALQHGEGQDLWKQAHSRVFAAGAWTVAGYACVPPTPFRLKDWERYDVSRYLDPGCIAPEEGIHTVPFEEHRIIHSTIAEDLDALAEGVEMSACILLAHAPPYGGMLDRAALDGKMVDHVPLDVHVGSIAMRRFIERWQPRVTLHGHVHESTRLMGAWREQIGVTHAFNAAHDGPELALIRFSPEDPGAAIRELL